MSLAVRLILLALAGALILPVSAAEAKSGPCLADYPHDTQCRVWNGKVRYVDDGDTLDADVPGDGLGGLLRVRIIGTQAMEQTSYRAAQRAGDCHALDATNRLEQLVRKSKKRIRVALAVPGEPLARPPAALDRGPPRRALARRRADPDLRGPRAVVARQAEDAANARYSLLTQRAAAAAHTGLFAPTPAASGPTRAPPIGLYAQWDADGNDRQDVNGEWVRIRNYDPINPLPLDGWYVRDSGLRRFTFPAGLGDRRRTARSPSTRARASTSGTSSSGT